MTSYTIRPRDLLSHEFYSKVVISIYISNQHQHYISHSLYV